MSGPDPVPAADDVDGGPRDPARARPVPPAAERPGGDIIEAAPAGADRPVTRGSLIGLIAAYTAARLALLVLLALGLSYVMPLIVATLFAVVIQMPLAWVLLRPLRQRTTQALAVVNAPARAERERLRAALAGDELP